ncbi:NifB/NifX family molybdenum-iron cluster-binding protein [Labilibacter marinus]|uniref:NifB/NifX family molybdenum-iron cluster-binding protein n=1 Tax=Labilibacter marinus TaxID=1477105 RepID=UPI00094F8280|nr:NifB/NifX family molybdenum-iron cluster-binding protein [Labilibacter marinus]
MKTVITSSGKDIQTLFDMRFGRAAYFCLLNPENDTIEFIENVYKDDDSGAGTKVAEQLIELGVKKVVSGDFGPKAKELLEKFNVQMVVLQNAGLTVDDIVNKLKD